jgi:hypothetical protein
MRQIRVALANVPAELYHLVHRALADQVDMALVSVAASELALLLDAERVDVVVVAMRGGAMPAMAERLLDEYPRLGIVCIDAEAGDGLVYRVRPELTTLDEISPRAIADAIRSATEDLTS